MPIELDNFRQKYPQYNDMSDIQLAESLYKKHPEYSDILQKTYVENEQQKSNVEPSTLYREVVSPLLSAASTATTGGFLKEGLGAISPEAKASMFPEQKTIPGKILRGAAELGATVLGAPARIVGSGVGLASKIAPKAIIPLSKVAQASLGQKVATGAVSGALGGASLASENIDPIKQAEQIASGAVLGTAIPVVAQKFIKPTTEEISKKISSTIKEGVQKAIRPSVVGKGTAKQQDAYFKKAESAIIDVLDNKENLELIDKNGDLIVGKNPESIKEALDAVSQTKENIFDTYSPMIKQASDAGAVIDGNSIARKLKEFSSKENIQLSNPNLAKYAEDVATRWEGKSIPLDVAEQTAKDFNAMLKQKYQQGKISGADISSAHVDDMVVRMLRNEISDKAGVGDLKKRYGALAELENDIAKRAIVSGRQNKVGLVESMASLESGADIAGAVAMSAFTGNPMWMGLAVRGIGAKAAGSIIKNVNRPDANISRMFKNVENLRKTATRSNITPSEAVYADIPKGSISEAEIAPNYQQIGYRKPVELPQPQKLHGLPNLPAEKVYHGVREKAIVPPVRYGSDVIPLTEGNLPELISGTRVQNPTGGIQVGEEFISEAQKLRNAKELAIIEDIQKNILQGGKSKEELNAMLDKLKKATKIPIKKSSSKGLSKGKTPIKLKK